jgi:hypothetical protein
VRKFRTSSGKIITRVTPVGSAFKLPKGVVVTDLAWGEVVRREELFQQLLDTFGQVVWYRGKFYRQTRGIPQGCALSVYLCSLYYAYMLLENLEYPSSLRMRWVDDTIFITPHLQIALNFCKDMTGSLGVVFNLEKSFTNFPNVILPQRCSPYFSWCGHFE